MEILLKKLKLTNFKGAKSLHIDFTKKTDILGRNGSLKSTTFDAFTWLLFGKNSQNESSFEIKTLDENNIAIPKIDHEVEGLLIVDGVEVSLKRVFREKWVKSKGELQPTFSGHATLYWWNDVPMNEREFKSKVDSICNEELFKLITNPLYFNSLNWSKERDILFNIVGSVSIDEILDACITPDNRESLYELVNVITGGKDIEEYKKQIAAKKKILVDQLKEIPTRVDEIHRGMPDPVDAIALNRMISDLNKEIDKIEKEIADESLANEAELRNKQELQNKIYELKGKVRDLEFKDQQANQNKSQEAGKVLSQMSSEMESLESKRDELKTTISHNSNKIIDLMNEISSLGAQWKSVNAEELKFNEEDFHCPACKRSFESGDIDAKKEELTSNFNTNKQKRLSDISIKGKNSKEMKESLITQNESLESEVIKLTGEIETQQKKIDAEKENTGKVELQVNPEIAVLNSEITTIEGQLQNFDTPDSSYLLSKKKELQDRITTYKEELRANEQIEKANSRISELELNAKNLGQEVANYEKVEFTISGFTKTKIELVEGKINSLFDMVTFKMYNQLINGGEEETCQALINGVPYSDANNASRINAGIDIINALSKHYGVHAPIFIDNAEAVNEVIDTDSQVVRLVVTTDDKLKVVHSKEEELVEA